MTVYEFVENYLKADEKTRKRISKLLKETEEKKEDSEHGESEEERKRILYKDIYF